MSSPPKQIVEHDLDSKILSGFHLDRCIAGIGLQQAQIIGKRNSRFIVNSSLSRATTACPLRA
ncbi:hypothetical protein ASF73_16340 [Xanthomonas sp. Leaf131]|nr:hypothetical protein ASF73_16340 [Xanthomonas sp. Leaf131]